ncbi:PE family protein, partial [Mycobacterium simiae]
MSFVIAVPEQLTAAAAVLAGLGSAVRGANAAAAAPTTALAVAAADEVSVAVASLFSSHAQAYQAISVQVAEFHQRFLHMLTGSAAFYASAEAANTSALRAAQRGLLGAVNAPTQALVGRPLIGNGSDGSPGSGATGGDGGLLIGNGGN